MNSSGSARIAPCNKSSCRSLNAVLTIFCSKSALCGVLPHMTCTYRTGELSGPEAATYPGHEIVGIVVAKGERVERFAIGQRLGVRAGPHLRHCRYCISGRENLCDNAHSPGTR